MVTVGVEEEYLLVDAATGQLSPYADKVRTAGGLEPVVAAEEIQLELLQAQVEVASPVCDSLGEVGGHLLRLRHAVAEAAGRYGCRIMAAGTAPMAHVVPVPVTDKARYKALRRQAPQLMAEQVVNGMHIHVAVPSRGAGVEVMNRLRPWLPTLTAMGANSPLWDGHDTGFASWRTLVFDRWPVSGAPPRFANDIDYDLRVQHLLSTGVIADRGQLYWQVRLCERFPTVEIRCLDVQLRADDAVMFAGLIRGLVETGLREVAAGHSTPDIRPELMKAALWQAARHGLSQNLIDPQGGRRRAGDVVYQLLEYASPALEEAGDSREVSALVHRLLQQGTGADRQRQALADGGLGRVIDMIAEAAVMP